MFQNRFDQFYITICKQVGGIEGLIKSFYDFMIRKTDFFYECDPGDKMGFPPGYSQQLLNKLFLQFQQQHYKRFPKKNPEEYNEKLKKFKQAKNIQPDKKQQVKHQQSKIQEKPLAKSQEQPVTNQKKTEAIVNTYNGGKTDKYHWSQQSREVEVTIQIEQTLTSKQLQVTIKPDRILIKKKSDGQIILDGELYELINTGDSVWKLQNNAGKNFIVLSLQKAQDKIWSTVFKGDPEIDTTKVNNTKPLKQFDEQTQGAIRKIMYEQQRKMQGLPTTEEEKQHQALKKAWDAEGSPFKGQPFDPSKFNLSGFKP